MQQPFGSGIICTCRPSDDLTGLKRCHVSQHHASGCHTDCQSTCLCFTTRGSGKLALTHSKYLAKHLLPPRACSQPLADKGHRPREEPYSHTGSTCKNSSRLNKELRVSNFRRCSPVHRTVDFNTPVCVAIETLKAIHFNRQLAM